MGLMEKRKEREREKCRRKKKTIQRIKGMHGKLIIKLELLLDIQTKKQKTPSQKFSIPTSRMLMQKRNYDIANHNVT